MDIAPETLLDLAGSLLRSVPLVLSDPRHGGLVAGLTAGTATAAVLHHRERHRARVLPHIPSLVEHLDGPQDEITQLLSAVHEMTMAVTDAWNAARARTVALESLESLIRPDALLPACEQVLTAVPRVRERLQPFASLAGHAAGVREAIDACWSYVSKDRYRTVVVPVARTDSKGRTRMGTQTKRIYDGTDHEFRFHLDEAMHAEGLMAALNEEAAMQDLPVPDLGSVRVGVDAIPEAERLFLRRMVRDTILEDPSATVTESDVERYANQWLWGTDLSERLGGLLDGEAAIERSRAEAMPTVLDSGPEYRFRTQSRSHPGPPGYVQARLVEAQAQAMVEHWDAIEEMLSTCEAVARDLHTWAAEPGTVESDHQYVQRAASAYEQAFPDSQLQIDQLPRYGRTIAAGTAVAAGVGVLVYFALGGRL